jgi:hypothetical protein
MLRNCVAVVFTLAIVTIAFIGTASVASSSPSADLSPTLPVSVLPKVNIPETDRIAIYDLISSDYAENAGITPESFDNARLLRQTEAGPLYVIPGASGGVCLALGSSSVGCNDKPTDDSVVIAAFTSDSEGNAIGGGLLAPGYSSVDVSTTISASPIRARATTGGFYVTSSDHVRIHDTYKLVAVPTR